MFECGITFPLRTMAGFIGFLPSPTPLNVGVVILNATANLLARINVMHIACLQESDKQ